MDEKLYEQLYSAVKENNLEVVKGIISELFGVNVMRNNNLRKWPYLRYAQTLEIIRLLLLQGVDVNAKDECGLTPLHWAIMDFKGATVIKELLKEGAYVDARDYEGNTPLILAVIYENLEAIKELMEFGANINIKSTAAYLGYSTCFCIAVRDYRECAKLLIKISLKNHFDENFKKIIDLEPYVVFENYNDLSRYLDKCANEIFRMQTYKVNKYFTLYDLVIKKSICIKPLHTDNITMSNISNNFPIYQDIIVPKLNLCTKRAELLDELRMFNIYIIVDNKKVNLNYDCIYKIAEHLSNEELLNFNKSICK